MPPLEVAVERLGLRGRLVWAFHAREVRFERSDAGGTSPIFPETFSFHLDRHDPFELQLQLEDLWGDPRRLGEGATRREAQEWLRRILAAAPGYLERILALVGSDARLAPEASARIHGDAAVLVRTLERFTREKELDAEPALRLPVLHLRKLAWRAASALVSARIPLEALETWMRGGSADHARDADPSERALLAALEDPPSAAADALLLELAERSYHAWLEDVCLDVGNGAFETEDSPFGRREAEVLAATSLDPGGRLRRTAHFSPFLRRLGSRDCLRLLRKLETFLLRDYDVPRAAAVIRHLENLTRGRDHAPGILSWHSTPGYLAAIALLIWPFVGAAFAYERAPALFDWATSLQILGVVAAVLWYLLWRFVVQKDLAFFHGAVPRIGAGIIVGYLPVFLIDEVWDLARRPWFPLGVTVVLLAFTTLLYLYVEVHRRIHDPRQAFARARELFLLGTLQALGLGLTVTTLLGSFMVLRTWTDDDTLVLAQLRELTPPFVGELPRILGIEPVVAFPTAVLLMTFLSFFIGTFLQLLWEDLPITEPL